MSVQLDAGLARNLSGAGARGGFKGLANGCEASSVLCGAEIIMLQCKIISGVFSLEFSISAN